MKDGKPYGVPLPLRERAERFIRSSAPHHRSREWYKIIEAFLARPEAQDRSNTFRAWRQQEAEQIYRGIEAAKRHHGSDVHGHPWKGYEDDMAHALILLDSRQPQKGEVPK